jgi:xanthine/CO dehydrogenase XdhC/CoxF family maturation factor
MHELQAIVDAYATARARGERAALATVISVLGSAYRRPGAKMLITETGRAAGSISGGCLERDVMERAAQVMDSGLPRIVEYDTRGDEDLVWGMGLGCNGVVRVIIESLHEASSGARALQFIADCLRMRKSGVIATVLQPAQSAINKRNGITLGQEVDRLLFDHRLSCDGHSSNAMLDAPIREGAKAAFADSKTIMRGYETVEGQREVFFDIITPPRSLVIFGAEHDALPVVRMARSVGWHTTVVDTKARRATAERFGEADEVLLCRAESVAGQVPFSPNTAAVVMTHNYPDDMELMMVLLKSPVCYLGILGPKQRTMKLLADVGAAGSKNTTFNLARLHSPIGLDIGAETPEEIALAIISEIQATCAGRGAGLLRDRQTAIHNDGVAKAAAAAASINHRSSARERAAKVACLSS